MLYVFRGDDLPVAPPPKLPCPQRSHVQHRTLFASRRDNHSGASSRSTAQRPQSSAGAVPFAPGSSKCITANARRRRRSHRQQRAGQLPQEQRLSSPADRLACRCGPRDSRTDRPPSLGFDAVMVATLFVEQPEHFEPGISHPIVPRVAADRSP